MPLLQAARGEDLKAVLEDLQARFASISISSKGLSSFSEEAFPLLSLSQARHESERHPWLLVASLCASQRVGFAD